MFVNVNVFKCLAFSAAMGSWLLAVSLTNHLGWVTTSTCFAATLAFLLLVLLSKIENNVAKKQVLLLCLSTILGWILVSLPFRVLSGS